jgi:hypothetical protein
LLDECRVHVEDYETRITPENGVGLQDYVDVPFALETVEEFMFAEVGECEVGWVGGGGDGELDDGGVVGIIEAAVGGGKCC